MLNIRPSQSGVSLVEIMIGLAIVAILFVAAAPSFSTFMQNSQIRTAAESIQNGLTLARVEAVRRNTNVEFVLTTDTSWTVRCETGVGDLDGDGVMDCPGAATIPPSSIQNRSAADGSKNASVNAGNLSFNGLGKVTSATLAAGTTATFAVANTTGGTCAGVGGPMHCLDVTVSSSGQVRMCNPTLPSTDPAAC